jgi:hypothetical protein
MPDPNFGLKRSLSFAQHLPKWKKSLLEPARAIKGMDMIKRFAGASSGLATFNIQNSIPTTPSPGGLRL